MGSKTNMARHYAEICGNWAAMFFSRLQEQGTWEKEAHD